MSTTESKQMRLKALTAAFMVFTALSLVLAFTAVLYTVVEVRETQVDRISVADTTRQAAEDAARSAKRIEDCTTPGRDCYEDTQKTTARAVGSVATNTLAVIVAALSCQDDGITEQKELARCTVRRAASEMAK